MWFKNLCVFQLTENVDLSEQLLIEKLTEKSFSPLGKLDLATVGWGIPLGAEGADIIHVVNGYILLCMQKEEKILPASAVNELLNARIGEIEHKDARKVRGKEKQNLKDEVILDMIPRAFSRNIRTYAYIDTRSQMLICDSSSANRAEELASLLRDTLGSLPVAPLKVKDSPEVSMTQWLAEGGLAADFVIDDECELRDEGDEGGVVRIRKHDLGAEEVQMHLKVGKIVKRLAMTYDERISFVLDSSMEIKRLKFLDVVQDQADNENLSSFAEIFDSDFAIMTIEISALLKRLGEVLGGLEDYS